MANNCKCGEVKNDHNCSRLTTRIDLINFVRRVRKRQGLLISAERDYARKVDEIEERKERIQKEWSRSDEFDEYLRRMRNIKTKSDREVVRHGAQENAH